MASVKNNWWNAWFYVTLAVAGLASLSCGGYTVNNQAAEAKQQHDALNAKLVDAVKYNNLVEARRLLEQGADPNTLGERGCTLLQLMPLSDPTPMLELLYEFKVDLNLAGCGQPGPLERAVSWARDGSKKDAQAMVTWLLQHGARVNGLTTTTSGDLLYRALSRDSTVVLEQLLTAGADPNVTDLEGEPPLLSAISYGDAPTKVLLSHGANPNIYNRKGWSPLLEAVESNDAGIVKLLLQHGADVHHGDRDGWTAYDQALLNGCPEIIAELEKAGATL